VICDGMSAPGETMELAQDSNGERSCEVIF
jgi:hypothetical protein